MLFARRLPLPVLGLLAAILAMLPSAALASDRLPTPVLIDQALQAGDIDAEQATLLRAQAVGSDPALPARYRSDAPWEGTITMVQVQEGLDDLSPADRETAESDISAPATITGGSCGDQNATLLNTLDTANFRIDSGTISGGYTAADYGAILEAARGKEVGTFGWAAPPHATTAGGLYHVRIDDLANGLMGFVTNGGTHAGFVGNNPSTPWNDRAAAATCMVLTSRMDQFGAAYAPGLLSSTIYHEYAHSIQFGLGLFDGTGLADSSLIEGGARWMEEEAQPYDMAATQARVDLTQSMGQYAPTPNDPYPYWMVWRGLTERFGVGSAGGGEQLMQDVLERLSRREAGQLGAVQQAMAARGVTLGEGFHDFAIAARFLKPCGGDTPAGRCFAEASTYANLRAPITATIAAIGDAYEGAVRDDYAANFVALPSSGAATYPLTVKNLSTGGALRATAICSQGTGLKTLRAFAVRTAGQAERIDALSTAGCDAAPVLVITNESTPSTGNPSSSALRAYRVSTAPPATFDLHAQPRTTVDHAAGSGTITVAPAGADCGTECRRFEEGTSVTLTAVPGANDVFSGWEGACTGTATTCTTTMDADRTVVARFSRTYTLTVGRDGPGSGTVTGAGIDCGADCVNTGVARSVTLTATAAAGSRFTGWSDPACDDALTSCPVAVDADKTVTATFALAPKHAVTVTRSGQGTVVSNGGATGISCGTDCAESYDEGSSVGLAATPAAGWRFVGWTGPCTASGTQCDLTVDAAKSIAATFAPITWTLTVSRSGSGTVSAAGVLECGTQCDAQVPAGQSVVLSAAPAEGWTFTGWSGESCSGTGTCTVTMTQARTVGATFTQNATGGGEGQAETAAVIPPEDPAQPGAPSGPAAPAADRVAPRIGGLRLASTSLRAIVRSGLRAALDLGERAQVRTTLTVDRRTARRLGLGPRAARTVIGRGTTAAGAAGAARLTVRLTAAAARKMAKQRSLRVRLELVATDAAGNVARTSRSATLRR